MEKDTIRCVFRAHQHGDPEIMSRILNTNGQSHPNDVGVAKLWQDAGVSAHCCREWFLPFVCHHITVLENLTDTILMHLEFCILLTYMITGALRCAALINTEIF